MAENWAALTEQLGNDSDLIAATGDTNLIAVWSDLQAEARREQPQQIRVQMMLLSQASMKRYHGAPVDAAVKRAMTNIRQIVDGDPASKSETMLMPVALTAGVTEEETLALSDVHGYDRVENGKVIHVKGYHDSRRAQLERGEVRSPYAGAVRPNNAPGMSPDADRGGVYDGLSKDPGDPEALNTHISRMAGYAKGPKGNGVLHEVEIHDHLHSQIGRRPTWGEMNHAVVGLKQQGISVPDTFGSHTPKRGAVMRDMGEHAEKAKGSFFNAPGMSTEADKGGIYEGMERGGDPQTAAEHVDQLMEAARSAGGRLHEDEVHDYLAGVLGRKPKWDEMSAAISGLNRRKYGTVPDSFGQRKYRAKHAAPVPLAAPGDAMSKLIALSGGKA